MTRFEEKFAFIGAGNLAEAWIARLIASRAVAPEQIMACDPRQGRLSQLANGFPGLLTSPQNGDGVDFAQIVLLAAPPGETYRITAALRPHFRPEQIVISLAAGVPMWKLQRAAGNVPIARVMANTPSMVGEGMNLVSFSVVTTQTLGAGPLLTCLALAGGGRKLNRSLGRTVLGRSDLHFPDH